MKCPHCGMNIRDNVTVCGYCGGPVVQQKEKPPGSGGWLNTSRSGAIEKNAKPAKPVAPEPENDEEEEDGLSRILLPGEQVLIGSLNISVKKFTFHAYLTDRRIFLIDTAEKKLKVTAKDVPRDTVVGSIVEFSENSDPVLVLSVKSVDDDIKTMKLVFTQHGVDRSSEIDDWIALLHDEEKIEKSRGAATVEELPEPEERIVEEEPEKHARVSGPLQTHELHPSKKPAKDHEKQPPTKRLLTSYQVPEPEPEVKEPEKPHRRTQFRMVEEPVKRQPAPVTFTRESTTVGKVGPQPVKKPEVQSAVKYAMKSPLQTQVKPSQVLPVKKPVSEPIRHVPEPVQKEEPTPEKRHPPRTLSAPDEGVDSPQFCHNCGKKLPGAANFCPGCGTKLGQHKHGSTTIPRPSHATSPRERTIPERKVPKASEVEEEEEVIPPKPPVKKAPKGSDMTILHKFLRR